MTENGDKRYVTNKELKEELSQKPSRWEVRFLILAAIVANQALPTVNISGKTAFHAIKTAIGI